MESKEGTESLADEVGTDVLLRWVDAAAAPTRARRAPLSTLPSLHRCAEIVVGGNATARTFSCRVVLFPGSL